MNVKGKLIFSPRIARALIQRGFHVIDIKPRKENPGQTIFVFAESDLLFEAIEDCAYKN